MILVYPVLFEIGSIEIYSYGVALVLAFITGIYFVSREAPAKGVSQDRVLDLSILIGISALIGSRLAYVILNWSYYAQDPSLIIGGVGGLSFHGGLVLAFLVSFWYVRRHNLPVGITADLIAPYVALGYAITRIGCFLNGCCYGKPSDLPWALPVSLTEEILRHPVQLYASVLNLFIFAGLLYIRDKKPFNGYVFVVYAGLYGLYRFVIEFFREEELLVSYFTLAQLVSLLMIAVSLLLIKFWPWGGESVKNEGYK